VIDREENGGVGLRRPVTIVYAAPTAHVWHDVFEAAGFYALVSMLLVGGTAVVLVVLIRRLLQPLDELASAASSVSPASLSFVPPVAAMEVRELRPLAEALSASIATLREAFEKEHRFVSDAAHELKTAVAVVRSSIQVLSLRTRAPEEYQQGLRDALTDNERVEDLVSRMLTLARFEEDPEVSAPELHLADAVQGTLGSLANYALMRGVALHPSLCRSAKAHITMDRFQTLVSNLVVNAVQHSPRGSTVRVSVGCDQRTVVFAVQDQGHGIAPENLPHVFERFYREDASRSRNTGGAGLGLAICKSIVDAAGGTLTIESEQGVGTTVKAFFTLV